jgi:hypothetical protein
MFRVFRTFQLKDGDPECLNRSEQSCARLLRLGPQYYWHHVQTGRSLAHRGHITFPKPLSRECLEFEVLREAIV